MDVPFLVADEGESPTSVRGRLPVLLVCFALEEERVDVSLPGFETQVLLTGVGKVNATLRLTEAILHSRPDFVLNVGTAGTLRHRVGDILISTHFVDRDHEGLELYGLESDVRTAGSEHMPFWSAVAEETLSEVPDVIVNTGDNFVTVADSITGDVVDMEAFAEAVVCVSYGLPFVSVKCVTDIIGENSVRLWSERLADARRRLTAFFANYR